MLPPHVCVVGTTHESSFVYNLKLVMEIFIEKTRDFLSRNENIKREEVFDSLMKTQYSTRTLDKVARRIHAEDDIYDLIDDLMDALIDITYYAYDTYATCYDDVETQDNEFLRRVGMEFTIPSKGQPNSANIGPKSIFLITAICSEIVEFCERLYFKPCIDLVLDLVFGYDKSDTIISLSTDLKKYILNDMPINIINHGLSMSVELFNQCFDVVHQANLNKRVYDEEKKEYNYIIKYDSNGIPKIVKPSNWVPPSTIGIVTNYFKSTP